MEEQTSKKKGNGISSFCNTASQVINGMTFSEKVHTALDVVGMVPVLGEVCDATNAVIYLMEGNLGEAAMSGAACIPGFGNAATAAKWAGKGVGFLDDVNDARKLTTTASNLSKMAGKASTASKAAKTATDTLTNKTVSETLQDLYKGMAGIFTGGATADAAKAYDKMKDAGNGLDGIHDAQKAADKAGTAGKTAKKADGAGGKGGKKTITSTLGNEIDVTPSSNHTSVNKNPGPFGEANTSVDILDADGSIKTRRWYDSNGKAYRDVDMSDHGNPKEHPEVPHEHKWEYNNGKPKRN